MPENLARIFRARRVKTSSGTFGHLRIFTFRHDDALAFINGFKDLLSKLPGEGLIVDVRGNGGGPFKCSEGILQSLTPLRIVPQPLQFLNTALNLRICRAHPVGTIEIDSLTPWCESMEHATETGATFSSGFSLTPEGLANRMGQRYDGPVVLITDARCYSATDAFAAGFQDHDIGDILAVDENTGAGGANAFKHEQLRSILDEATDGQSNPYQQLPNGAAMSLAVRRALRVGKLAGTPVEDLGVTSTLRHKMTLNDLLGGNVDLLNRAGELLKAKQPARSLKVGATPDVDAATLTLKIRHANLERADVFVDGRPLQSPDLIDQPTVVVLRDVHVPGLDATPMEVRVQAYAGAKLAAARFFRLQRDQNGVVKIV